MLGGDRWVEVSPSQFTHEAEGLRLIRDLLPDEPPYRAWSNFEFRDSHGKWHEVDLAVLGQRQLHLVELKYYTGTLRGNDIRWLRDGHPAEDSPLKLARRKGQRLAGRLRDELLNWAQERGARIPENRKIVPYVQECVFLHHPRLRCLLPVASRTDLFSPGDMTERTLLPDISERLLEPPRVNPLWSVSTIRSEMVADLMKRIGLVQRRQREVGSWIIDEEPLTEGEDWQDWPAFHRVSTTNRARIRFLVSAPGAALEERTRTRRIAEHEFRVMRRLSHDGLLCPQDLVDNELGPGLVYPLDDRYRRLDLWLADHPGGVPLAAQMSVLRQVAETLDYAHRHRVVHRGLTPSAVHVRGQADDSVRVLVGDWQTVASLGGSPVTGASTPPGPSTPSVTALGEATAAASRLAAVNGGPGTDEDRRAAQAYQAPEGVWKRDADRVRLDVFALGALAYYLFTGQPPACDRATLRARLLRDRGLDPAADLPEVPSALRELVLSATHPKVSERIADLPAFLARFADAERALATPEDETETDPLEAVPGTVLSGRFRLERRLGSGSTAVGLLVTDLDASGNGTEVHRVLKVAVDDAAEIRLVDEAEVLAGLDHPRLVRLVESPLTVGGRRALLLASAGEQTLAEELRGRARLSLDLLERWGNDLLDALLALDTVGVDHRDIKPANLGVRENRGDRAKHLVLFDFSLTRAGAAALNAGTPPYLDPFLGGPGRIRYDSAAERYAAAVVLFEMATGRVPAYGDGLSDPAVVDTEAGMTPAMFDPSVAEALMAFFTKALARDSRVRHDTAREMLAAWQAVFAPVPRTVPGDAGARAAVEAAEAAGASTPLAGAGLSARALSALEPLGLVTVGDLVTISQVRLNRLSGVADATRREIRNRAERWRQRLGGIGGREPAGGPGQDTAGLRHPERTAPKRTAPKHTALTPGALPDPVAAACLLVEGAGSTRAHARRTAARVLLGLDPGLDAFAAQGELGKAVGASRVRGSQLVEQLQSAWARDDACRGLLDALAAAAGDALDRLGGVATVDELSEALLAVLPDAAEPAEEAEAAGRTVPEEVYLPRMAAGLLRVVLDRAETRGRDDPGREPLARRRRGGRLALLATSPPLLTAAEKLGHQADELVSAARASAEPLAAPLVVPRRAAAELRERLRELLDEGLPVGLEEADDTRLVRLAAVMSRTGAVSGRGELHDRDLAAADALGLALAGLAYAQPVRPSEIQGRVRARFPALPPLSDRPRLDELVAEAGLPLVYDESLRAFRMRTATPDTTGLSTRRSTHEASPAAALSPFGGHAGTRLAESVRARSFLALGVEATRLDRARHALAERCGAAVVDVTLVLLDAMREQAASAGLAWEDTRLVPLAAGLAELQPRVEQWHADVDPTYGVSLAAFCREELTNRAQQVGLTPAQLSAWRPTPTRTRYRKEVP